MMNDRLPYHDGCPFLNRFPFLSLVFFSWFRMKKFASFQRQLNMYGFERISRGMDKGAHYHPLFVCGKKANVSSILRNPRKGGGFRKPDSSKFVPDFWGTATTTTTTASSRPVTMIVDGSDHRSANSSGFCKIPKAATTTTTSMTQETKPAADEKKDKEDDVTGIEPLPLFPPDMFDGFLQDATYNTSVEQNFVQHQAETELSLHSSTMKDPSSPPEPKEVDDDAVHGSGRLDLQVESSNNNNNNNNNNKKKKKQDDLFHWFFGEDDPTLISRVLSECCYPSDA